MFFYFFIVFKLFASADDFLERQRSWISHHSAASGVIQSSDPNLDPIPEFSKLSLNERPHPELYHVYIRSSDGERIELVKDVASKTLRLVRLYGAPYRDPSYVTMGAPETMLPKETLVNPISARGASSSVMRNYPSGASSSYPTGVKPYHIEVNGIKMRFDRGHGIPHQDTLPHPGITSTRDAENYVPQNEKYNSPIRRDLENQLRSEGLKYKEIAIYHSDCEHEATTSSSKRNFRIPVPEGFLLMTYSEDGEIQKTYYFPNLIDYEDLSNHPPLKGENNIYERFKDYYCIEELAEWFFNPMITIGEVDDHQRQVEKARRLGNFLLLFSPTFFKKFTEEQMPPKARSALLMTLLEWNVETAATLELSFSNQLALAHFYLASRGNLWEFDSRYAAQKEQALASFLSDPAVSPTASELVRFLGQHLNFTGMQYELSRVVSDFKERYRNSPHKWGERRQYFQYNQPINITLTALNGDIHQYNFLQLQPTDMHKIKELIGGLVQHDERRAEYILSLIDMRARQRPSTLIEKLGIMRLLHDYSVLQNEDMHLYWEKEVFNQVHSDPSVSLLDRRRIIDYYAYRSQDVEKAFWLQNFVEYVANHATFDHFSQIAEWCVDERAAFLEDMREQDDPIRASNVLALILFKGLKIFHDPKNRKEFYSGRIEHLADVLGLRNMDTLGFIKAPMLHPDALDPYLEDKDSKLKQLAYVFFQSLPVRFDSLPLWIPGVGPATITRPELCQGLAKKNQDYKDEARVFSRFGMVSQSKKAAQKCYKTSKSLVHFKEAALILHHVGLKNLALTAAHHVFDGAKTYRTEELGDFVDDYEIPIDYKGYIYAVEAFHALGENDRVHEAKDSCLRVIEKREDFVLAAARFYTLGFDLFAREAAQFYFESAKSVDDLRAGVVIFYQHQMFDLAKEAAECACQRAKNLDEIEIAREYYAFLGLPSPVLYTHHAYESCMVSSSNESS